MHPSFQCYKKAFTEKLKNKISSCSHKFFVEYQKGISDENSKIKSSDMLTLLDSVAYVYFRPGCTNLMRSA